MSYPTHLIPTTIVGSYPQPEWLVDRDALRLRRVPRVHAPELWRVSADLLEQAQDDATVLAIRDMERAGIDIITDGEIRRESYSNRFALSLEGIDSDHPAEVQGRTGPTLVPRVVGKIRRRRAVEVRDAAFLRSSSDRATKITLPGPFTLAQQAFDEFYRDEEAMAMDYAAAVNEELRDIIAAGVDVVQLDEPWMQARPDRARRYGVRALNRALAGIERLQERARHVAVQGNREYHPGWHTALDLIHLLTVAEAITRSALERKESRGAQFREDYPNKDAAFGQVNIVLRKGSDGAMQIRREPIPALPAELKQIIEEMK